jgi:hypothetical protein
MRQCEGARPSQIAARARREQNELIRRLIDELLANLDVVGRYWRNEPPFGRRRLMLQPGENLASELSRTEFERDPSVLRTAVGDELLDELRALYRDLFNPHNVDPSYETRLYSAGQHLVDILAARRRIDRPLHLPDLRPEIPPLKLAAPQTVEELVRRQAETATQARRRAQALARRDP